MSGSRQGDGEFFTKMQALEDFRKVKLRGRPSYGLLADQLQVDTATVRSWLAGKRLPQEFGKVGALVLELITEAKRQNVPDPSGLLDVYSMRAHYDTARLYARSRATGAKQERPLPIAVVRQGGLKNGGYRLVKSIAQGGYAEVFRAEHRERTGQFVAFKRPRTHVPLARERMLREIEVQRQFTHPHIMPILDADDDTDEPWFVMPIARGNLEDLLIPGTPQNIREIVAIEVLNAVAQGLHAAHELGYVHRDISPRNILDLSGTADVSEHHWVVADWGIVKRPVGATTNRYTQTGEGLGTAGFAAPETWSDAHNVGFEADVYSLGRVIAWLLTGKQPTPNIPLLPEGGMRGLIAECTENNPAKRIPTVSALRERLAVLQATPELSPRATVARLVRRAKDGETADIARVFALAQQHEDDELLYLDDLTQLPPDKLAEYVKSAPENAAEVATTMLQHLVTADWSGRNYDYANVPLGWTFTVVQALFAADARGLAEDLATEFFNADKYWNRYSQLKKTLQWLKSMHEQQGIVIARAIRRAGVADYYRPEIGDDRIRSQTLAAELGL